MMEPETRRIVHRRYKISNRQMDRQQLREATPWGYGPKYLIHARDSQYTSHFSAVAAGTGIQELRTPYRVPRANGVCERFMGSLQRECFDQTLILQGRQLQRLINEYAVYYNQERPHQGIDQRIPNHYSLPASNPTGNSSSRAILGGLHHSYFRAANPALIHTSA